MLLQILKAFIIGICASAPIGPVAILVLQKSLSYGSRAGFATGLGATTVDTIYATISIFALAIARDFIGAHQLWIFLIGGLIISGMGFAMAFKDPFRKMKSAQEERGPSIRDYLQAVATALSNPGAIFVMFALFAFFKVNLSHPKAGVFPILLAVALGSMSYWYLFSRAFGHWRRAFRMATIMWLNRVTGIVLIIIGITVFGGSLFDLVFKRL